MSFVGGLSSEICLTHPMTGTSIGLSHRNKQTAVEIQLNQHTTALSATHLLLRQSGKRGIHLLQIPPLKGEYRSGDEMKEDFTLILSAHGVQMGMFDYESYRLLIRWLLFQLTPSSDELNELRECRLNPNPLSL